MRGVGTMGLPGRELLKRGDATGELALTWWRGGTMMIPFVNDCVRPWAFGACASRVAKKGPVLHSSSTACMPMRSC